MRFRLTNRAYDDLKNIARYTQTTWGIEQRNEYLSRLDQSFRVIAENVKIGRNCDHIKEGYCSYSVGKHLVFYKIDNETVLIVRVLHQSMDIESQL
ncbi:MAG: type II toxin-antitoxin system RelE/ParE family toxin [Desulfovibrionaceae bacterium]